MKHRTILLAAILAFITATAAAADEHGEKKSVKSGDQSEEKTNEPAENYRLNLKELFGCEPMGEDGHMMTPEPASEKAEPETRLPAQEQGPTQ